MLVIALTGGIGSGKSAAAERFAALGVPIIDADVIARDLTVIGQPAYNAIKQHFGAVILQENGMLNRQALRTLVFTQPAEKEWLETALHPLIRTAITDQIQKVNAPYCIVVIPLLLESEANYDYINRILVIDAPESVQMERVIKRDGSTQAEITAIMASQVNRTLRLSRAHDIITNDGTLLALHNKVDALHQTYLKLCKP